VPKNRAAFSAPRPKASWPKAPCCCSTRRGYAYAPTERSARYDAIGMTYAATRRDDPRIAALIHAALGDARTVVNVGAGTGSYEPRDREVIAVEPSEVMIAQRDPTLPPPIQGGAYPLPFEDESVDAAMAVLTVHHWDDDQERGVREMRRIARGPVVILTFDPEVSARMWLIADYLPEVADLDRRTCPPPETLAHWLGGGKVDVRPVPISRHTPDWSLGSFWAHPERVLDARARQSVSGFARMPQEVVDRVVATVERDLHDGTWEARHGRLRELDEYDAGLRLVVSP
jgi:SAM-dependent methyltransferase